VDAIMGDFRFALRSLRQTPAFTLSAVVTLALGIGAATAMFSTLNATLLRPFPYPDWEDIRSVRQIFLDGSVTSGLLAPVELARLNETAGSVRIAAGSRAVDATLLAPDGSPNRVLMQGVTAGFFELFGLPMALGTSFTPEYHVTGGPEGVLMAHRVWREQFGGNPRIVGTTLRFADRDIRVVGVAPPAFDVPRGTEFWVNLKLSPVSTAHNLESFMRVEPGTTAERLDTELTAVFASLARDLPGPETGRAFMVTSLVDAVVGDLGPTLIVVFAATALLLVLACVNVTNLLFVRAVARTREIAIREALGASRARILRQLLVESLTLAAGGALVGLAIAYGGVRLLLTLGASELPRLDTVPFEGSVLAFTAGVLVISSVLVGLAPAARLARLDIVTLINESNRTTTAGKRPYAAMGAMIVAEISLAVTLVAGAGWLIRSFDNLRRTDPGFRSAGRIVFDVNLPTARYRESDQATAWFRELFPRLEGIAGITRVGSSAVFPLRSELEFVSPVAVAGRPPDSERAITARRRIVSPGFFEAMGTPMVSGRAFTEEDGPTAAPVAIVNEAFVRRFAAGMDVSSLRIAFGFPPTPASARPVVGVVRDVKYDSLAAADEPAFYLPQDQLPAWSQSVVVSMSTQDVASVIAGIRAEVAKLDPLLALEFESVPQLLASMLRRQQVGMALMIVFGAIALTLAAIGIYGISAYVSSQRRFDVATRMALGASPSNIFWSSMSHAARIVGTGGAIGLAAAYGTGRLASSWLYEVRATDAAILLIALAVVSAIALAASAISARRASLVKPVSALRLQ
jgi:putative ABC transport system permease protein